MMRLSEAAGRVVLSRESAEPVGELRHVVIDAPARRIVALHVTGRRAKARLVDWGDLVGFGPDAIVVPGESALRAPGDDAEAAAAAGHLDLDGRLVLDDRGVSPGSLTDVVFDEGSGVIAELVCGDEEIAGERLRVVGPYCVLVAHR